MTVAPRSGQPGRPVVQRTRADLRQRRLEDQSNSQHASYVWMQAVTNHTNTHRGIVRSESEEEALSVQAVDMYGIGASLVNVGKAFGVNATTVRDYRMKLGFATQDAQRQQG